MTRAKEHLVLVGTCSEKKMAEWESWRAHGGAMPAEAVLSGQNMLDWLGPVAAMESGSITVHRHDDEETAQWSAEEIRKPGLSDEQMQLARLEELKPAPAVDAQAQRIIDSLGYRYPQSDLTKVAAARSVTQWTKHGAPPPSMESEQEPRSEKIGALSEPRCVAAELKVLPVEIGNTTHLVLQYLDFDAPADAFAVAQQINELVSRRLISAHQARSVDIDGIVWVMSSDIGNLMRTHKATVRRELPFYLAVAPNQFEPTMTSTDPLDQVMVRGRMDAVIETDAGLIVVDYKTDRIGAADVSLRARSYAGQVQAYRQALERIAKRPVVETILAFLAPQVLQTM